MASSDSRPDREILEKAIALQESLRGQVEDAVIDATIAALQAQLTALEPPLGQQRKQVTVLFMDVVSSTEMVRDLDPEDNLAIMDTAMKRLSKPVLEHGGQVNRYMGDGFLAVFGHPTARENDPDQAVLAGLAILKAARTYGDEAAKDWGIAGFDVRIGIHTGLVVIGGHSEGKDTLAGLTVNLAARLESASEPGTLSISHQTYQHVRGAFDTQPITTITAKGFPEPVKVYRVLREKAQTFRTRRRGVEGVETRMIGRDAELERLKAAFSVVLETRRQQIGIAVGEAGIGKSRLLYEFENWVARQPDPLILFRGRAYLETRSQPYGLLRDIFSHQFRIQEDDPLLIVREKLSEGFQMFSGTGSITARSALLCGQLLGFNVLTETDAGRSRDARQMRDQAVAYLIDYFRAAADRELLLLLLEDLHWADTSSLNLLSRLGFALQEKAVLILCATRQDLFERQRALLEELPPYFRLDLRPLSPHENRKLVREVLKKSAAVPSTLIDLLVENTEGNPFYLEELVKMLVEDGVIVKGEDRWQILAEKLGELQIPVTLTGVLQARLEALPADERLILQQASVVGRVFWDASVNFLQASEQGRSGMEVRRVLESLQQREIIYRQEISTFVDTDEYLFKHTALREVTYESVLKRLRKQYHARVADWLILHGREQSSAFTGMIADHLEHAGRIPEALQYLRRAGEEAQAKYANEEAIAYYTRALALSPSALSRYKLLAAREKLFSLLGRREEQHQDLQVMTELSLGAGTKKQKLAVKLRWVTYYQEMGDYAEGISRVESAVEEALQIEEHALAARGYNLWGTMLMNQGRYRAAREHLEKALDGFQRLADPYEEGRILNNLGGVAYYQCDYPRARRYYGSALAIARETGNRVGEGFALNNLGNVATEYGDFRTARDYYRQALEIKQDIGDRLGVGLTLGNLGTAALYQGDNGVAQDCFEQSMKIAEEIGDEDGKGWALHGFGETHLALGKLAEAKEYFTQAIELRETLDQEHLALVSRTGLARALLEAGDQAGAYALVAPILSRVRSETAPDSDTVMMYLTCIKVLQAQGDPQAEILLQEACASLEKKADQIHDPDLRRSYLENLPWNRELSALRQASLNHAEENSK